jgi:hypothetical protein
MRPAERTIQQQLFANLAMAANQAARVRVMRDAIVAVMQSSDGESIVVNGRVIYRFPAIEVKQDHMAEVAGSGWGDDVDLRILAAIAGVRVVAHTESEPGVIFTKHEVSYEDSSIPADLESDVPVIHVIVHADSGPIPEGSQRRDAVNAFAHGAHFSFAELDAEGSPTIVKETPRDGHCAFHAFYAGLAANNMLKDIVVADQFSEDDVLSENEVDLINDSLRIVKATAEANRGLAIAMGNGLDADKLLNLAEKIDQVVSRRFGQSDEFLQQHIKAFKAKPATRGAMTELAGRIAARAAVNVCTSQALNEVLQPFLKTSQAGGSAIFKPAAEHADPEHASVLAP